MNYDDINMYWTHAEKSMIDIMKKIKQQNPGIKIFFYDYKPNNAEIFSEHGDFITDLHSDEEMLSYFQNL